MEWLGGLLVVLVIAYVGLMICAGGLCAAEKVVRETDEEVKR